MMTKKTQDDLNYEIKRTIEKMYALDPQATEDNIYKTMLPELGGRVTEILVDNMDILASGITPTQGMPSEVHARLAVGQAGFTATINAIGDLDLITIVLCNMFEKSPSLRDATRAALRALARAKLQ